MFPRLGIAVVLIATAAKADNGLEAQFTGPVLAGETAVLVITLDPACCPPPQSCYCPRGAGIVQWGDGFSQEWYRWGGCKPQDKPADLVQFEVPHNFAFPGRYVTVVRYDAMNCGTDYTLYDSLNVEVGPTLVRASLGVFFDRQATVCSGPVPPGTPLYVVAELSESNDVGLAGAELRVQSSHPDAFFFGEVSEPGWIRIGSVFGDGASLGSNCVPTAGPQQIVVVSALAYPQGDATNVQLLVEQHRTPSNPNYRWPMLILCDSPIYTAIVAFRGVPATLNPTGAPTPCQTGLIAVQLRTWSEVKNLYR